MAMNRFFGSSKKEKELESPSTPEKNQDDLFGGDPERNAAPRRGSRLGAPRTGSVVAAGFAPSNYLGADGIDLRSDLTGLNLSEKPKALVEFGNMTDSADIAVLRSEDGRSRMADAVVAGIETALAARG